MRCKRRYMHGKKLRQSPLKKDFDFSKKADYSKKATEGTFGAKFAKAVTPENSFLGFATSAIPVGRIFKAGKAAYNYFTQS